MFPTCSEHGACVIDALSFKAGMTLGENSLKQPFLSPVQI